MTSTTAKAAFDIPAINNQKEALVRFLGLSDSEESCVVQVKETRPSADRPHFVAKYFEHSGVFYRVAHWNTDRLFGTKGGECVDYNGSEI